MKAKVIPTDPVEFAQYLHDGTSDEVRIKAFGALVDLGYMKHDSVLTLLLNTLSTDCSAYTRSRLFEIFMLGLADIAFGDPKLTSLSVTAPKADGNTQVNGDMLLDASGSAPQDGSLIIDEDVSLEARKVAIERLSTIDGAVAALKKEMQGNLALREALWKAISSGRIGVKEQSNLLDLCAALYEAVYSMEVVLKKPRYIKAKHLGKVRDHDFCEALLLLTILTRVSFCSNRKANSVRSLSSRGRIQRLQSLYLSLYRPRCLQCAHLFLLPRVSLLDKSSH